jgi:hypothetical protein
MTYDIVVPAPGIDLLGKLAELRRLQYALDRPFEFMLPDDAVTRSN